jgi:hypothetical protein
VPAFHRGAPVAFGWLREHHGGPVRVLAGGPALAGGRDGDQVVLTLPAGARALPLPAGQAAALMARMPCWVQLAGVTDALLAGHDDPRLSWDVRPSLEEGLLSAWSGPFAWLLLAEPLTRTQVAELADEVSPAQLGAQRSDSYGQADPGGGPHPRTAEWEAAYSRGIPGQTCASQLETVQRWYDADQRSQQQLRGVAFGTRPASAIEHAFGARAGDQDWEQRLADALAAFRECRWPLDYLHPDIAGT